METTVLHLESVIQAAKGMARENNHQNYSSAHLLRALLRKDTGLIPILDKMSKDVYYMQEWADVRIEGYPKAGGPVSEPRPDDSVSSVMREADFARMKLGREELDPLCVLAAVVTPGVGFSYEQLKSFPLKREELLDESNQSANGEASNGQSASGASAKPAASGAGDYISKYCIDKTQLAAQGKIDPIIGRDKEVRMMTEILGRRSKPNVIIIGEPGVGKTALVEGFAINIAEENVMDNLKGAKLFEIDLGALVAGASYKGEVEDRIRGIIREVKAFDRAILFIDEIHALMDQNRGLAGVSNLLKPELARGELTLIGASTLDEYREYLEPEEAFMRRFEVITVDEPNEETCSKILEKITPLYEDHHGLKSSPESNKEAIRLAKRYLKERRLPDAAIDLVDRTMAAVKMMNETSSGELEKIKNHVDKLAERELGEFELYTELQWSYTELENRMSPILLGKLNEERIAANFKTAMELTEFIKSVLERLEGFAADKKDEVNAEDIAAVVAHRTGIPIGKVQSQEKERLMNMESVLASRVIGQDHAVHILCDSILESRSGLMKAGQPIGSFFLLGPTGTGKTELAKALSDFLFADETSLIRFDMSEFKEEHSAALLYGAPPGYIGYKEGGLLVNKIRQKPYAVVLFDEIEKAHPSVFDLFLQILDEGKLHDRLGKEGDFSNAVILFTSNIGSQHIIEAFDRGEIPKSSDLMEIMGQYFRPEFLARLTEILPFRPINEDAVLHIFRIQARQLVKALEHMEIGFKISEEAEQALAMEGFTPKYGARPLRGVIRNKLRRPISRMIIAEEVRKGDLLDVTLDENQQIKLTVIQSNE